MNRLIVASSIFSLCCLNLAAQKASTYIIPGRAEAIAAAQTEKLIALDVTLNSIRKEIPYAALIDSALVKDAARELTNELDCKIDQAWSTEKDKVESALLEFKNTIGRLSAAGATSEEKSDWNSQYKMIYYSISDLRSAYVPNAARHEQYIAIYKDLKQRTALVKKRIAVLNSMRSLKSFQAASSNAARADGGSIANEALARWSAGANTITINHNK